MMTKSCILLNIKKKMFKDYIEKYIKLIKGKFLIANGRGRVDFNN